ncbi:hypothetical protein A3D03_00550 [Candidatus Gottesmanbacteria bacterium RIFCSPHIGHO2_02_FULL_40_13]|uniref:Clp R domain-containing protein n=1 Tax=Candidatus Gottesmanbacteria bacterium RIFCSPHIGHO2_02_FULL_40_13 TaxID=1798384 RepID=A0A1F6A9N4_9BACT|nr:MAG: hypothetical protein A3D03_00550 [Candidatus Gottesmanbacteria bacterium RIFCSPHIGHO2_02_FULL_40_13]
MSFLPDYLDWHYQKVLFKLLLLWRNLTLFPMYYFSVGLHLKTLLSPWKKQTIRMKPGFHLEDFMGVVSFNIISRIMGLILRGTVISYGIFFFFFLGIIGFLPTLLWCLIPFLTIPIYLKRKLPLDSIVSEMLKKSQNSLKNLALLMLSHRVAQDIFWRLGLNPLVLKTSLGTKADPGNYPAFWEKYSANSKNMGFNQLVFKVIDIYEPLKNIISDNNLKLGDVEHTASWVEKLSLLKNIPMIWDLKKIKSMAGIGVDWAYGFTVEFDKYSRDLTKLNITYPFLVGREEELEKMQRILMKTDSNNILIIGDPGVGRHILVETMAYRIKSGDCRPEISHKRILSLSMHSLISSKPSVLEVKGIASEIIEEASNAGNIFVMIDDIDKFVATGEGRIDLTDVLMKFTDSDIGFIGITDSIAYHKFIETNSELDRSFEKIYLHPPSMDILIEELELSIVPVLERKHKMFITYPSVKKTIEDAEKYITTTPFPGKAIELMDQSAVYAKTRCNSRVLQPVHIDQFIAEKLSLPLGEIKASEKDRLLNIEKIMHQRVVNQEKAIDAVASAIRRSRLGISSDKKPVGTFLFLGPTGVGKTETAKALAHAYFGDENNMLRFDMGAYQKEEGLERLIGSIKIGSPGELTSRLRDRPFSLILLDEIEKADKQIYNLFLTLIDEGYITDYLGHKIFAKNAIIIATSNAGAEFIRQSLTKGIAGDELKKTLLDFVQKENIYSPEFLNRFDEVVVFTPLTEGQMREVARLMLEKLNKRLSAKEISIEITPDLIRNLASFGYDPQFGARSMNRTITEKIENQIAIKMLEGNVKKGEAIKINL